VIEVFPDGSFVVGKLAGTGGAVTVAHGEGTAGL
jgi:hypothetical protein